VVLGVLFVGDVGALSVYGQVIGRVSGAGCVVNVAEIVSVDLDQPISCAYCSTVIVASERVNANQMQTHWLTSGSDSTTLHPVRGAQDPGLVDGLSRARTTCIHL